MREVSSSKMEFIIVLFLFSATIVNCAVLKQVRPPEPKFGFMNKHDPQQRIDIARAVNELGPEDERNAWEMSGLLEGDIMTYSDDGKNGLVDESARWPQATVPYYIEDDDFTDEQQLVILKAFKEYHNRTCIRFRPYTRKDKNWVVVRGNSTGCWSSVGKRSRGQVLHLQTPACVRHGIVVHEFLHALGFYHMQSASNRDDYVKIMWQNIKRGTEHNFNKYNKLTVTDYGVEYDFGSVMHYSRKAFSKNDMDTIVALKSNVTLGQRRGLSEKDILKLEKMYSKECELQKNSVDKDNKGFEEHFESLLDYFYLKK